MNLTEQLINELFERAESQQRCPYIRRDKDGRPYCGKGYVEGEAIEETRRMICDVASLQLWCLSSEYERCIYYQGEEI